MRAAAAVISLVVCACGSGPGAPSDASPHVPVPTIDGPWRELAGNPDLGALGASGQQPVDFAIWQAADGSWQLESCIRFTLEPGGTRLFYRWRADHFEDVGWTPVGIAMHADPSAGELEGWLQAPFVLRAADGFHHLYGGGDMICDALGADGVTFTRRSDASGQSVIFTDGAGLGTRDVMVLRVADHYVAYTTNNDGVVNARTSTDLATWSDPVLVARGGAAAGSGGSTAECPFVVYRADVGLYYLFRNQRYGATAQDSVYASPDPMDFGVDDDRYFVTHLPIAAAEIVEVQGETYVAALRDTLDGIHVAHLSWR